MKIIGVDFSHWLFHAISFSFTAIGAAEEEGKTNDVMIFDYNSTSGTIAEIPQKYIYSAY